MAGASRTDVETIHTVWLFGERDFPIVEINNHAQIDVNDLPVTAETKQKIRAWLEIAGFESSAPFEKKLTAASRAARSIADDTPPAVRVNIPMFVGTAFSLAMTYYRSHTLRCTKSYYC